MSEDFEGTKDDLDKELPKGSEGHSDYKPADTNDANVKHQLSGMYQNWFLDYASYVISGTCRTPHHGRLKPVQRRILHSMRRMEDGRYNKVANIVGHTMQFHPHGDASIGDALVQLGQKDLLIDCQGNWGNILRETAQLPPVISKRVFPSLRWMWCSTPKLPNGNCHTTDETRNRSLFLSNSHCCWRREWKVSP